MNKKVIGIFALLMLVLSSMPIIMNVKPVFAAAPYGKSIVIDDSINRVNATLGVKSGSQITAKGVIKNIGATTLTNLLTGVYFIEGTPGCVPGDFSFEFSNDCVTWYPIDPSEIKVPSPSAAPMQVELVLGQPGGETLLPGQNLTLYLRMTFVNDLTPISWANKYIQSMIVWVFGDTNPNRHWDGPPELIYSQPPIYAGYIDWDNPIKIDLAVVHTAEIDGTGKFCYNIQDAINAAIAGDTILLYDGTYAGALYINKNLTIKPASTPIITGSQLFATDFGNREATIYVENAANVVLQGLDIQGSGLGPGKSYAVLYENSGGTVKQCTVSPNTIGDMNSAGIAAWSNSNLRVESCTIKNFGRIGIYSNNATMTILGNKIIGQTYAADDLVNYGIEIEDYSGPSVANITLNEIYGCNNTHPAPQWSSCAIIADTWREYYLGLLPSTVSITYNNIHDNYEAIEIVSNDFSYAYYNNFTNNVYGVFSAPEDWFGNPTYYVFDARYNWWGHSSGPNHSTSWLYMGTPYGPNPGLGDPAFDYVLYKPWMSTPVVVPLVHNVAVLPPIPETFKIEAGSTVQINVTAINKGTAYENFTVTICYNSTHAIATQSINDLAPGASKLLTFNWDTTGVLPHKYYTLKSVASVVPGETSTSDNTASNLTPVLVGYFPTPTLKVEPAIVPNKILFVNETFNVNVTLNGLSEDWHTVGAQCVLSFDSSLVEVASVTEGPFFGSFTVPPQQTLFAYAVENPYGLVMDFLGPNENATYSQWPHGSGTIATVTFRVLRNVARGAVESSDLMLTNSPYFNTMLIDNEMNEVPHNSVSGTITILGTIREDVNQDGRVDIVDVAMVSGAFGSYPGHQRWNPDCDINQDGRVDIIDVAMVSGKYGWFRDDC